MPKGPQISVIVPCYQGADAIGECLASLAAQDLSPQAFEVLVVLNGPDDGTRLQIDIAARAHRRLNVRLLTAPGPGVGRARNLGLDSAAGTYVTFVDHDDWVSPSFLSALLAAASPGVVSMSLLADVSSSSRHPSWDAVANYDNYIGAVAHQHAGELLPRPLRRTALGFNAAKLVPTAVARAARYDETLPSGEDLLYWFDLAVAVNFGVRMVPADSGATYYRRVRPGSLSRQERTFEFSVQGRLDVIERLAARQLDELDPDLVNVRRSLAAGQTSMIRAYVDERPEEAGRVVEEIHRRGLADHVSWRVLNTGRATELAAVVGFTPWLDTSGLVAARRVRERGVVVDLIQSDLTGQAVLDHSSSRVAQAQVARSAALKVPLTALDWAAIKAYVKAGRAQAAEWIDEQGPYESLYTRAMLPASHLLGAVLKVEHPQMHWRAEFSDPIVWNGYGQARVGRAANDKLYRSLVSAVEAHGGTGPRDRNIAQLVELVAFSMADELLFTNAQQLEFMLARLPDPSLADRVRERAVVQWHPVPDPALYEAVEADYTPVPGVLNIGYFGVFYPTRGLTEVVEALAKLDAADRARVHVHVFTSDPAALAAEVTEHGLGDVITANPYAPYLEFLALTRTMDLLLVNDFRTLQHYDLNPYLPAKWSDYTGSGTDMWAVVEPGSVLSRMENVRYTSVLGDADGAHSVLVRAIADHLG